MVPFIILALVFLFIIYLFEQLDSANYDDDSGGGEIW